MIKYHFQREFSFKNRKKIRRVVSTILLNYKKPCDTLNIIFCDDPFLLSINQQYLKHDFFTDIITFDLSPSIQANLIGEIYISIERVKENAKKFNISFQDELARVIFHGVLHLCGQSDNNPIEKDKMSSMEDIYLQKLAGST